MGLIRGQTVKISDLPNLGPKSEEWLAELGIESRAELERVGSVEVYRLLRQRGIPASLNLVYAIEAALLDIHWTKLPPEMKMELRKQIRTIA